MVTVQRLRFIKKTQENSKVYTLSKKEFLQTLFGLWLGDGNRELWVKTCSLRLKHCDKQREYTKFKHKWAKRNGWEHLTLSLDKHTTKGLFHGLNIRKLPHSMFGKKRLGFDGKHRYVSNYVLDRLNPLALLFWYLDDGYLSVRITESRSSRCANISIAAFDESTAKRIVSKLNEKFGLTGRLIVTSEGHCKYYMSATCFKQFYDIVRPYLSNIPMLFKYKFDMQYVPGRRKDTAFDTKYNGQEFDRVKRPEVEASSLAG